MTNLSKFEEKDFGADTYIQSYESSRMLISWSREVNRDGHLNTSLFLWKFATKLQGFVTLTD